MQKYLKWVHITRFRGRLLKENENYASSCWCETLSCIFKKGSFRVIIIIIVEVKARSNATNLSEKYFEKELHSVTN